MLILHVSALSGIQMIIILFSQLFPVVGFPRSSLARGGNALRFNPYSSVIFLLVPICLTKFSSSYLYHSPASYEIFYPAATSTIAKAAPFSVALT